MQNGGWLQVFASVSVFGSLPYKREMTTTTTKEVQVLFTSGTAPTVAEKMS